MPVSMLIHLNRVHYLSWTERAALCCVSKLLAQAIRESERTFLQKQHDSLTATVTGEYAAYNVSQSDLSRLLRDPLADVSVCIPNALSVIQAVAFLGNTRAAIPLNAEALFELLCAGADFTSSGTTPSGVALASRVSTVYAARQLAACGYIDHVYTHPRITRRAKTQILGAQWIEYARGADEPNEALVRRTVELDASLEISMFIDLALIDCAIDCGNQHAGRHMIRAGLYTRYGRRHSHLISAVRFRMYDLAMDIVAEDPGSTAACAGSGLFAEDVFELEEVEENARARACLGLILQRHVEQIEQTHIYSGLFTRSSIVLRAILRELEKM